MAYKRRRSILFTWKSISYKKKAVFAAFSAMAAIIGSFAVLLASSTSVGLLAWLFVYGDSDSEYMAAKPFVLAIIWSLALFGIVSAIRGGSFLAMKMFDKSLSWKRYGLSLFVLSLNIIVAIVLIIFH